jgi:PKD repeat protein
MMKKIILSFFTALICSIGYSQANANCSGAAPFCSDQQYSFPMNVDAPAAESGPDYGCLGSEPNPAWYYMQIDTSGDINIYIESQEGEDVDFICYGPFITLTGACTSLTASNTVDCSYSASPTENCYIPSGVSGEYYLLLLTNFSNNPSTVNFSQTFGSGSTDCSILNVNAGNNGPLCTGDTLVLNVDTVTGGTYSWTGPAGFTSSVPNPIIGNVTLANAGLYTCIVFDVINSVSDTVTTTVVINPKPTANLVVNNPYCLGDTINLDASGTTPLANILAFYYDFDNNGTYEFNTVNPIYNASSFLTAAGNYPISLITDAIGGCSDTVSAIVQIYNKPTVGLSVVDPTVCLYNDGAFQALAFMFNAAGQSSTIANYEWDFTSDGIIDQSGPSLTNTTHHFPGLGTYPVVVTVTSNIGCERSDTVNVTIVDIPHGNILSPNVCGNQAASFTFNNTGLAISSYDWNFGDLTTITDISTNSAPSYLYPGSGNYNVTVIVGTGDGCLDTMYSTINISPLPSGTISGTPICQGQDATFTFTQTSSDTIVSYAWTFPGATPATSAVVSPTINFPIGGTPNVSLIVTNSGGCSDTIIFPFTVNNPPSPNYGIYPVCISRYTFDPYTNSGSVTLDWDMGDGTVFNDVDTTIFNHVYTGPGDYITTLTITDQFGCTNTLSQTIHISDSVLVDMPNVLVQSSTIGNNQIDMDQVYPAFNLCIDYTYTVFDRWGVQVFQSKNKAYDPDLYCNRCFKGKTSSGATLSPGVYYYVIEGNFNILKSGAITIFD